MNILIEKNKEIKKLLDITNKLLENTKISSNMTERIKIIYEQLIDIEEKLKHLNINLKNNNDIDLNDDEKGYLETEKKSNELLSKIMPALVLLSIDY